MIETRDEMRLQPVSIMLCGARPLTGCSSEFDPTAPVDPEVVDQEWLLVNLGRLGGGAGMSSMAFCSWACSAAWGATAPAFPDGSSAPSTRP